jgi:peptide/nickel transport system permease protein
LLVKRLFGLIPVVFGILLLTFLLVHLVPGDPVDVMLGDSAASSDREQLRVELALNQSLPAQFIQYISHLVRGDFGRSIQTQLPISTLLLERIPRTTELAFLAMLIATAIGLPLGIFAALNAGKWLDQTVGILSLSLSAMPHFWLGPLLMLEFALWLGWLPVSGMDRTASIILPAMTLGFGLASILTRMTRASLLEILSEDFVRTARAKGLSEHTVILRHALRAALLPIITVLGLQLGSLLAGAVITETVFGWDGIGRLLVESIEKRDYPVTQACVLVIAISYVLINLVTDVLYAKLDPRLRLA